MDHAGRVTQDEYHRALDRRDARIRDLQDTLALRDAAVRALCIATHGCEIEGKTIYDLIHDVEHMRQRALSASQPQLQ